MKITNKILDAAAKAIEREYHREAGVCSERNGGPDDCWVSMRAYARVALRAAIRAGAKK